MARLSDAYEKDLTDASFSALLELAVTLKSYDESLVLVGGWVPYLLIDQYGRGAFAHVGSIDIDIAVDPELVAREEYSSILEMIQERGYRQKMNVGDQPIHHSFERPIESSTGNTYNISVDFLTSGDEELQGHRHLRVQPDLRARIAKGCDIAFSHNVVRKIDGFLPGDGRSAANLRILDIAGCMGMKGVVLGERYREKDAYDIFSVASQCLEDPPAVAREVRLCLGEESMNAGIANIKQKFRSVDADGPSWVGSFMHPTDKGMRERAQAESFVVMRQFLRALE